MLQTLNQFVPNLLSILLTYYQYSAIRRNRSSRCKLVPRNLVSSAKSMHVTYLLWPDIHRHDDVRYPPLKAHHIFRCMDFEGLTQRLSSRPESVFHTYPVRGRRNDKLTKFSPGRKQVISFTSGFDKLQ